MNYKLTVILFVFIFASSITRAWDEVTHAYISEKVLKEIRDPSLQELLERNKEEFLSGCWFSDTYQYTDTRFEMLNPHDLDIHCNVYLDYLQKEDVKRQENYEKLLAFLFGSVAHVAEDFWLDNILYHYPQTIGEDITGDLYNGVISINKFNYLKIKVVPYLPLNDLYSMYRDAGLTGPEYDTPEKFQKQFNAFTKKQYQQMRLLKLLSFLASNQVQVKSPWMSENIMTAPGGILSSAKNAARYLEAFWQVLLDNSLEGILNHEFFPLNNRLGILAIIPQTAIDESQLGIRVLNSEKDTLTGFLKAFGYGGSSTGIVNMVFQLNNDSTPEGTYDTASIVLKDNDSILYYFAFETGISEPAKDNFRNLPSNLSTLGTGFFLFVLCLGFAGILWGLSGIYPFLGSGEKVKREAPFWGIILQRSFQLLSISVLILGTYLFFTHGWLVILNV